MKKLIGIMLVLALMGTFGCLRETTVPDQVVEDAEVIEEGEISQEDIEVIRTVESEKDCKNIVDEELKTSCEQDFIYQSALDAGDSDKCYELASEYDQASCLTDLEDYPVEG